MFHYEEKADVDRARLPEPARAPAPQAACQPPDEAALAEMRRKLLVYGTTGNPARTKGQPGA
jgi:hypothetical protein